MKNETNEWPQTLNLSELAAEHDLHIIILPRPDPVLRPAAAGCSHRIGYPALLNGSPEHACDIQLA